MKNVVNMEWVERAIKLSLDSLESMGFGFRIDQLIEFIFSFLDRGKNFVQKKIKNKNIKVKK